MRLEKKVIGWNLEAPCCEPQEHYFHTYTRKTMGFYGERVQAEVVIH